MFKKKITDFLLDLPSKKDALENLVKDYRTLDRNIYLEEITPQVALATDSLIRAWNQMDDYEEIAFSSREPIKIFINSYGGLLTAAMTIVDSIKASRTPVITINLGTVYKESFFIYLAGTKRVAYANSSFLCSFNFILLEKIQLEQESTFYNYSSFCEKNTALLKRLLLETTKITESQYEKYSKKDWWFTAEDAQKIKICNEISNSFQY